MIKKITYIATLFILIFISKSYAEYSDKFLKTISYTNIPISNVDGYYLNEDIFYKYNLMVYGSPTCNINNQRWKDVDNGKWINETTGKTGEYRILGYSLRGTVVNNELFPDDYNSGTSPEDWNYIYTPGALNSWNDTEKYQTIEQYEYMINQKLSRNGITYNLTSKDIGIDKARVEAYATWKTAGSIFTLKRDSIGNVWEATFNVPPMASDAKLNSRLDIPSGEKCFFNKNQEELEIPIVFGAEVTQLGEYAKKEDIVNICAELEVDNNLIDKINSQKVTSVIKDNKIIIRRRDYPDIDKIQISIRNTALLETCFQSEVPMVDVKEKIIEIIFNEEKEEFIKVNNVNYKNDNEIPRPTISNIKLYRKNINYLNDKQRLYTAKKTNTSFICAGQVLIVEANVTGNPFVVTFAIEGDSRIQTLDNLTKRFVYDEPKARGEKMMFYSINELKALYNLPINMNYEDGIYKIEYIIPYQTKQTLNSWSTLRDGSNNAFSIDKEKLFTRIISPYKIKIYARNSGGSTTRMVDLDVFERWDTIYNRNISEYVK